MKFFNIDQHIACISDLMDIFGRLGHQVNHWSMSDHAHVRGWQRVQPKIDLNPANIIRNHVWDAFYDAYKDELSQYDGFIACYPPVFGMLYQRFEKPVILHVPIRYEHPFTGDLWSWGELNKWIRYGVNNRKVFLVANNLYDKWYLEEHAGAQCEYIPSLCEYTGMRYRPVDGSYLCWMKQPHLPDMLGGMVCLREHGLQPGYRWEEILNWRGIIHVPYQVSTMSIFEHYAAGIPLLFPDPGYLRRLHKAGYALREIHRDGSPPNWCWIENGGADYYNRDWMPHIKYYDSPLKAHRMVEGFNVAEVSRMMQEKQKERRSSILSSWDALLRKL